jgi:hypothetical protein
VKIIKGLWQDTMCQQEGKGWETHWKARGRCQEGGGESRKDQTHNTVQPIGVRTGCKVALLADHRMFRY